MADQTPTVVVVPGQPHNFWGTLSGAGIGAMVGTTVFPVVGTALGAVVGGGLGYILRDNPLATTNAQVQGVVAQPVVQQVQK